MGERIIKYSKVSSEAFVPAVQVRDILKVRAVSRADEAKLKDKKADVICVSPMGYTEFKTRRDILDNYSYISGNDIKMAGWKSDESYLITKETNTDVMVLFIPKNMKIDMESSGNGKIVENSKGKYLVCRLSSNGTIDKDKVFMVSADMFKKMFKMAKVDINSVIARVNNAGSENSNRKTVAVKSSSGVKTSEVAKEVEIAEQYKFRAIATQKTGGKVTGFVIEAISNHARSNVTTKQMEMLCDGRKVSNLTIVKENDKSFLRGVGIKISELPTLE